MHDFAKEKIITDALCTGCRVRILPVLGKFNFHPTDRNDCGAAAARNSHAHPPMKFGQKGAE